MPKLYYSSTSCGMASFIAAHIAGVRWDAEQVNLQDHKTFSNTNFFGINPKGNVPALVLDDGTLLNEGAAVLQYIADQAPNTIAPQYGERGRYLVQQYLNYVASELHPFIGGLFNPAHNEQTRKFYDDLITKKLTYLDNHILRNAAVNDGRQYLVGDSLTIADLYMYIVLSWCPHVHVDLSPYPIVQRYFDGIKNHDLVKAAYYHMESSPERTN
jgi:glutathione S-transferase